MFGFIRSIAAGRYERQQNDLTLSRLSTFGEILGSGHVVMIPMGVLIRRWAEERVWTRLSPAVAADLETEEFFRCLDSLVSALSETELALLKEELNILSSPSVTGIWREDFDAENDEDRRQFTDGLGHWLLSEWIGCKLNVLRFKNGRAQKKARKLEGLCFWHMTQLVRVVKGESLSED